jgi:hypothetical protein
MPMTREQILQEHASARVIQEKYDTAFEPWGVRARAPTLGEDIGDYHRDLAVQAKRILPEDHELKHVPIRRLDDAAFSVLEPQVRQAAHDSAYRADTVPYDAPLRRVPKRDVNGMLYYEFIGQRNFVHDYTRPGRRVTSFRTDGGYVDASGRPLR